MFGHMKAQPMLTLETSLPEPAIAALVTIAENAQPVRWIELPGSILLFVSVQGDPVSGAFYAFDRKTSTWFWIDFDDLQYGGYSQSDFDLLSRPLAFRTIVEVPWQNGVAERWVGSCRRDLLDHVIVLNERHLKRLMAEYVRYYHHDRTHLGLAKDTPVSRPMALRSTSGSTIRSFLRLGGLHHRYAA